MNKVFAAGRLTKDPEVRTVGETTITKFTVAVSAGKDKGVTFIPCTAFGKLAEYIGERRKKGQHIMIEGRWNSGSYERDGKRIYTNDCVVNIAEWEKLKPEENEEQQNPFMDVPKAIDEELPFN